jgi:hypothetical protein
MAVANALRFTLIPVGARPISSHERSMLQEVRHQLPLGNQARQPALIQQESCGQRDSFQRGPASNARRAALSFKRQFTG